MKPAPFAYLRTESLNEALEALSRYGGDAVILAGGQSLMPLMAHRQARPQIIIDINRLSGALGHLAFDADGLHVGALVRHGDIKGHDEIARRFGVLRQAASHIGNGEVRNRGTFCGALAYADPAAEWPVVAVGLEAKLHLQSARGSRWIAAADFFHAPFSTARAPGEMLCDVLIPQPRGFAHFDEIAPRRTAPALASLMLVETDKALRLVVGGVTGAPVVLTRTAAAMGEGAGRADVDATLEAELAGQIPTSDSAYRLHLVKTLLTRSLRHFREDLAFAPA